MAPTWGFLPSRLLPALTRGSVWHAQDASIWPILKHGPRSAACAWAFGWQTPLNPELPSACLQLLWQPEGTQACGRPLSLSPACQSVHDMAFEGSRCLWKASYFINTPPSVHGYYCTMLTHGLCASGDAAYINECCSAQSLQVEVSVASNGKQCSEGGVHLERVHGSNANDCNV